MTRHSQQQSPLFLLEITLAILFFSLASAVCLRCFAKSHILSQQTTELNQAVSQTENVAELLRSLPENRRADVASVTERLQEEYPLIAQVSDATSADDIPANEVSDASGESVGSEASTSAESSGKTESVTSGNLGQWSLYFDGNWNSCEKSQAAYQMQIVASEEESSMVDFHLSVSNLSVKSTIYQLELKLSTKES